MHILTLSHFLAKVIHQNCEIKMFQSFSQQSYNITLWRFQAKEIFQNQSQKHYTNHIRQLCIGKDRLISVKYWLNFTKVENGINRYSPILTDISNTNQY